MQGTSCITIATRTCFSREILTSAVCEKDVQGQCRVTRGASAG